MAFCDAPQTPGDKYTIQVDPDLRVGPGSREQVGVQSLKGIIEEGRKRVWLNISTVYTA